ncbi:hypothetical protein [Hyphomicrobium nitrativorans]|nr:hypothetical protein [Hyphomicrobium nitrativorans]
MTKRTQKKERMVLPPILPGEWRGDFLGGGTINMGQVVQDGPPRQSVEFSYMILSAAFSMTKHAFQWPGIVMIMAPTPMKPVYENAGTLMKMKELPSLTLALDATREQFSDLMRLFEARRIKKFHFTIEAVAEAEVATWPIRSWGMMTCIEECPRPQR